LSFITGDFFCERMMVLTGAVDDVKMFTKGNPLHRIMAGNEEGENTGNS